VSVPEISSIYQPHMISLSQPPPPHLVSLPCSTRSLAAVINVNEKALHVISRLIREGESALFQLKMCLLHELHLQEQVHLQAPLVSVRLYWHSATY
jgi:hypothetical protein